MTKGSREGANAKASGPGTLSGALKACIAGPLTGPTSALACTYIVLTNKRFTTPLGGGESG